MKQTDSFFVEIGLFDIRKVVCRNDAFIITVMMWASSLPGGRGSSLKDSNDLQTPITQKQKYHRSYSLQTLCIITQRAELHTHEMRAVELICFFLTPKTYQSAAGGSGWHLKPTNQHRKYPQTNSAYSNITFAFLSFQVDSYWSKQVRFHLDRMLGCSQTHEHIQGSNLWSHKDKVMSQPRPCADS